MKMTPNDYSIVSIETPADRTQPKIMTVVGTMGSIGMTWPPFIHDYRGGAKFRFSRQGIMEDWMVGQWGGCAEYLEIL